MPISRLTLMEECGGRFIGGWPPFLGIYGKTWGFFTRTLEQLRETSKKLSIIWDSQVLNRIIPLFERL
jgi:hypothetical protein